MSVKMVDCYCDYASHDSDQLGKPYSILMVDKSDNHDSEILAFDGKAPWHAKEYATYT